jgi:hypothetical protein
LKLGAFTVATAQLGHLIKKSNKNKEKEMIRLRIIDEIAKVWL